MKSRLKRGTGSAEACRVRGEAKFFGSPETEGRGDWLGKGGIRSIQNADFHFLVLFDFDLLQRCKTLGLKRKFLAALV